MDLDLTSQKSGHSESSSIQSVLFLFRLPPCLRIRIRVPVPRASFWKVSKMEMIIRGTAQAVPFSVWANWRFPWKGFEHAPVRRTQANSVSARYVPYRYVRYVFDVFFLQPWMFTVHVNSCVMMSHINQPTFIVCVFDVSSACVTTWWSVQANSLEPFWAAPPIQIEG